MSPEVTLLALSAAAIAFLHTVLGADHYLPFIAMAKARGWSIRQSLKITLLCGVGHLAGSVALGLLGITVGVHLSSLEWLESVRGDLAAWLLIGFGIAYTAWGVRMAVRNRPHTHWHSHDDITHRHVHTHHCEHVHLHEESPPARSLTPWFIFTIFVLGPCEPLIPLLMYPAAKESLAGVLAVTAVFGLVTVATMLLAVAVALHGLQKIRIRPLERYAHAMAGSTLLACGLAIVFLGL